MSARRSTSSTAPASSTTARCCSRARQVRSSPTKMFAGSISARASSFSTMGLGPRLDLRQSQQLVMTPQLQQAIKLLTLSNLELETYVAEEIEKNPLLETAGEEGGDPPAADDAGPVESFDGGDDFDAPDEPTADRLIAA